MIVSEGPPTVSWLMCTNTSGPLLFRALDSCLNQSFDDFEIVLVINGKHRDEIYTEVAVHYPDEPRLRLFSSSLSLLNHSLNYGLDKARGEFIARLDSDDVAYPTRLEKQVHYLRDHPKTDILGSAFALIDADGKGYGDVLLPESHQSIAKRLRYRNVLAHPTIMYRKDRIAALGGYLGGQNAEDYDLWLRALLANYCFSNLSIVLTGYNQEPNGHARRSRFAYSGAAASLLRCALVAGDFRFFWGSILYLVKAIISSKRD